MHFMSSLIIGRSLDMAEIRTVASLGAIVVDSHRAFRLAQAAWTVWTIWWVAMSFSAKSNKRAESGLQRLAHIAPVLLGFLLIFRSDFSSGWLARRIFPDLPALMFASVVLTFAGLLFSVWARLALGRNWSGTVTIKKDHQLIDGGPYRWIRHPIYTGMLAALLATAVAEGLVSGMVGFAMVTIGFYWKARREESFLAQEFGETFSEHRQRTGMFLPRLS
jgi:protein-S-isoprenylcysteine O-methyltransferase Ste14